MKKMLVSAALIAGLAATAGPAAAAPTPIEGSIVFHDCDFKVIGTFSGKANLIATGAGEILSTSPGLEITLTNAKTGESVSYVITGSFNFSTDPDTGNTVTTARGTNLLTRTVTDEGIYITTGNFSFVTDAKGKIVEEFSFNGPGQIIDVCAELS